MPMEAKQQKIEAALKAAPVVPVMVIDDKDHAVPLARALVAGGLSVLEITLRTPAALAAIRMIIAEVKGAIVGAGTVTTPVQLHEVAKAGCAFAVSPGIRQGCWPLPKMSRYLCCRALRRPRRH